MTDQDKQELFDWLEAELLRIWVRKRNGEPDPEDPEDIDDLPF